MDSMLALMTNPWIVVPLLIWSFAWKGAALWSAARYRQLGWFIALLVINTFGVLEIIYLTFFRRDRNAE